MQQLLSVWFGLDGRKRATVIVTVVALFASVLALSRLATAPTMALLYSGLEPGSAGQVVKALEQKGVQFEVRAGGIFVDSRQRDQLRMSLAADGLPANDGKGYELLDTLSGFGTTAQMFDATYWRAKEGELARTIVASPRFSSARVHISNKVSSPFRRGTRPTAAVTVAGTSGGISARNARALKYLIASAVAGMDAADVVVIDGRTGVVIQDGANAESGQNGSDRADRLRKQVMRLLEARVGPGNAIVEVNVETSTDRESIFERTLDPDSRVVVSSQKQETSRNSNNSATPPVSVASNLPSGNAQASGKDSSSQDSETRETTNYEVSEKTREISRVPGDIKRVSVAVLVNDILQVDPQTAAPTWKKRDEAELSDLRDLVSSAIGFDADRGDTITLKSLRLETLSTEGTLAEASTFGALNLDVMRLIQLAVLGIVSLVLGLFVIRPILAQSPPATLPGLRTPEGLPNLAQQISAPDSPAALTGEIDDHPASPANLPVVGGVSSPAQGSSTPTDPVARLREMISDRQDETAEILQTWATDQEERA